MSEGKNTEALLTTVDVFGDQFGGERMWGLKELPASFDVSWFPQTAGWMILISTITLLSSIYLYKKRKEWRSLRYYRVALKQLQLMREGEEPLTHLPVLLKSCALQRFEREDIASLSGMVWIDWLNQHLETPVFEQSHGHALLVLAYQQQPNIDHKLKNELLTTTETWLRAVHASI